MLRAMAASPNRQGLAARRTLLALAVGVVTGFAAFVAGAPWPVAVSGAWGAAAVTTTATIWLRIGRLDPEQTRANARAEDFSRPLADLVVLVASVASLIAIAYTLVEAGNRHGAVKALLILLAFAVVALSWALVHTLFALRYGDLYYGDPVGGIDFKGDDPDYLDFAYLAFTIGMTFQVSDTEISSKALRRTALRHALLSFLFVAVIVALAINSVASLLR
jgi:uncharacterized membrane protein